jgi:uncharacterized YigZ family protein
VRTIMNRADAEIPKIKGSRFFGFVDRAPTLEDAKSLLAEARTTWPDATHHCWAWCGDGESLASDDGEPSGTAGAPILKRLEGADLVGVVLIVMRYYGGTKLGTGGLVRAYGEAATEILAAAEIVERRITARVHIRHPYTDSGAIQGLLHGLGLEVAKADYGADVSLTLDVPVEQVSELEIGVRDRTSGRGDISHSGL